MKAEHLIILPFLAGIYVVGYWSYPLLNKPQEFPANTDRISPMVSDALERQRAIQSLYEAQALIVAQGKENEELQSLKVRYYPSEFNKDMGRVIMRDNNKGGHDPQFEAYIETIRNGDLELLTDD